MRLPGQRRPRRLLHWISQGSDLEHAGKLTILLGSASSLRRLAKLLEAADVDTWAFTLGFRAKRI